MNTRYLTNTVVALCAVCILGIATLAFFIADDWYAHEQSVTGVIVMKKTSLPKTKKANRYHDAGGKMKDTTTSTNNSRYYFVTAIEKDTLLIEVVKNIYLSRRENDSVLLTKSVGYFTGRVFYAAGEPVETR